MSAEPAQPAPPLPEPVLPEARPYWLDWFAGHATVPREHVRGGTPAVEPGGSVGVSAGPLGSGGGNAAMHECEHEDRGHGMAPFMESALEHARVQERSSEGWELQHVRARVQELEALLELQRVQAQTERTHAKKMTGRDSQASFASIASSQRAGGSEAKVTPASRARCSEAFKSTKRGEAYKLFWPEGDETSDFARVAARFNATIVPVAAVGAEEGGEAQWQGCRRPPDIDRQMGKYILGHLEYFWPNYRSVDIF